jgi:hypothetical protein
VPTAAEKKPIGRCNRPPSSFLFPSANNATIEVDVVILRQQHREVVGNNNDDVVETNVSIAAIVEFLRTTVL